MRRRILPFSAWHLLLMPVSLIFVLPLVHMVLASFMTKAELNRFPPRFIPDGLHLDGYRKLFAETHILLWLSNTVVVAAVSVVAHLVLCSAAGYGFARLRFAGRGFAFAAVLATVMIPIQLLMIPTYLMFARLGIVDTLAAAFVPWLASAFGIFLMRQFFLSLPVELEEAARIDGCGVFRTFVSIVLPLARPALATLAVFTLLSSWNDLLWPLVAISDDHKYTLQVGLASFQGMRRTEWSQLMAGNVVATMPLVLAFLFAQKRFVATMTLSGLKG
ncbi:MULTISPECIES: carbohydrate ABC transporter permease [Dactylosporangium]|uniref:ABC transporter permease n=2 Tax=Dactylosporangium TaxID=35753 RepID=A0A9W6NLZ1_9ACTN|nr:MULTISPECIES: carbohydrate ABC transporter permease [Dactylosporangium]UAB98467.1 carbohydrate ABC transporter permease [Dactylosporangium vinaceum]UWZ46722.1 carbohydrate ABC transporter permease [Dactylosporangium matsuzakiense]GLL01676.1 ABC transporter permease [Dactylosporangium matsuzakiense]